MNLVSQNKVSSSGRPHILVLDGLRFCAAMFVAIGHSVHWMIRTEPEIPGYTFLKHLVAIGMPLFFVLSGFVIHYNYRNLVNTVHSGGIGHFLMARLSRLYPLFLVVIIFDTIFLSERSFPVLPYYYTFTQSWFYFLHENQPPIQSVTFSQISWSVSTEIFFYLSYIGLVFWLIRSLTTIQKNIYALVGCYVCICLFYGGIWLNLAVVNGWAVNHFGPVADYNTAFDTSFIRWLVYFSPYSRIGEFIIGALMANIYFLTRNNEITKKSYNLAKIVILGCLAGIGITYWHGAYNTPQNETIFLTPIYAIFIGGLIYFLSRYPKHHLSRLLSLRFFVIGGALSYSIYLLHPIFFLGVRWPGEIPLNEKTAVMIMATMVMAWVPLIGVAFAGYYWFERPVQNFWRKYWPQVPHTPRRLIVFLVTSIVTVTVVCAFYQMFFLSIPE